jgi:hypothetical protein
VDVPEEFQGRSLLDVIERNAARADRRVFSEVVAPNFVSYAVRDQRFKYIRTLVPGLSASLYDLEADPGESRNLLGDPPPEGVHLVSELERFIQLGQHGMHLAVVGVGPGAATRVTIATEAEIATAFRFSIATGDDLETSPDGKAISLSFTSDGNPRHLVVETRPPGAALRLNVVSNDRSLSPEDIVLGLGGDHPAGVPAVLEPRDLVVSPADAERLLHDTEAPVRAWYLPLDFSRHRVDLDEETTNVLRALGYIQ